MSDLRTKRVAVLATDGFEESELTEPTKALRDAGAAVDIVSLTRDPIRAFRHNQPAGQIDVDATLDEVSPDRYDAVLLPGGALNADALRTEEHAQRFVRRMCEDGKPMAAICHAPWLLVSAGIAGGRTLTSWPTIADDVRNAGGNWVDREVVIDDNLVTSRGPNDIPAFNKAVLAMLRS